MKKIISILVAMLMVLSMIPAFAAIEVDTSQPSKSYYNDLSSYEEGATSVAAFTHNASNPTTHKMENGAYSVSRTTGSTKTGITYIQYGQMNADYFTFGYDVKFSGITDVTSTGLKVFTNNPGIKNTVFQDSAQENIDKGVWVVGSGNLASYAYDPSLPEEERTTGNSKASKTAWCFVKSGSTITFSAKKDGDEFVKDSNGKIAIFLGNAQLDQDAFYTVKVYADQVNKEYKVVLFDSDKNLIETGISGKIQNAFTELVKLDATIFSATSKTTTVTLDNVFATNNAIDLRVAEVSEVSSNGTITFGATLPAELSNPAVYVNNTLVENLTLTPGAEDYNVTVALPEGTTFDEALVEVRATYDGKAVSASATTILNKTYKTFTKIIDTPDKSSSTLGFRRIATSGCLTVPATDSGVWALSNGGGEFHLTRIDPTITGIVELSFRFNPTAYINSFRMRMTANTDNGYAFVCDGDDVNSPSGYHYYANGTKNGKYVIGKKGIEYKLNEWNTFRVRVDFYNKMYYAYVNDTLAEQASLTVRDATNESTSARYTDRIMDTALIINPINTSDVVYLDDFKFEEFRTFSELDSPTATVKYASGDSALYEGTALDAINVTGFDFATPVAFDAASINAANVKIVNSADEAVPATYNFANGVISAAYAGAILPPDNYKLVVGKNATINGEAIGANYEIPFALSSDATVLSPSENENVIGTTNLKLFAYDADKVVFKINDATVKTFEITEADSTYEYAYAPTVSGTYMFDAYVYSDEGVNVVSSQFVYAPDGEAYATTSAVESNLNFASSAIGKCELVQGAGNDGSAAVLMTSYLGTKDSSDALITKASDSGWTGLGKTELYRKWYMEIELKPGENTWLGTEVGFNQKGLKSTSDGYATPGEALRGRAGYDVAMFNQHGKILGTDVTFTPNKWYKFCNLIDCDAKVNVWTVYTNNDSNPDYETLVLSISDPLPTSLTKGYENTVCVYSKYKLLLRPSDFSGSNETKQMATAYIDNYKRYMPVAQPVVETISANGATIVNDVIAKGTDAVTVTLDKAYYSLTAADIAVTVDGKAVGTVTVVDNKTFTISGLGAVAEDKKINVKLADTLKLIYNYAEGSASDSVAADVKGAYEFNIYVGDSNGVYLYPLAVETETGAELWAYSKYISGNSSDLNTYLIMTEYANDDKTLVSQTNFAPVTVEAGKTGIVSGYLTGIKKAEGCQVMLWNTDFAPILEAGALAQ